MTSPIIIPNDVQIQGDFSATTMSFPDASIDDDAVSSSAAIQATKLVHQFPVRYSQASGTDVTTKTELVHRVYGATATLVAVKVIPDTAPTGGDKAFTVDVKKSTGAAAFATVLSSVVTVNNSSVNRTVQSATISSASAVAGDVYEVVITTSGSTGSQGQGVLVVLEFRQAPA